jgi:hypothetical protein
MARPTQRHAVRFVEARPACGYLRDVMYGVRGITAHLAQRMLPQVP